VIHLVSIQDKSLYGEPDIAIAVVDAADVEAARRAADDTILELAEKGRGRCVPHAREVDLGRFYRLGSVVRMPPRDRDVNSSASGYAQALRDLLDIYIGDTRGPIAKQNLFDAILRIREEFQ
jgi:hypothetical protein